ncbi:hypothetical protein ROZALSC1DRAFT_22817 [Rozella allomycis CSF55]|uniref:Uncharacterized protein n=1 Tax=Rozella allomycis (strain CSF55) TaxID=988480 RepID=A0A4P9YJ42_ROZAC|nr:hypothetical protein ROZALSC1DRAFT_22817 [Rozella allomycis CSF55]
MKLNVGRDLTKQLLLLHYLPRPRRTATNSEHNFKSSQCWHCNGLTNGCQRCIKAGEKRVEHSEGSASCASATALKPSNKANLVWTVDSASTDHLTSKKETFELYK